MPMLPTRSDLHVNRPLGNLSVAYRSDPNDYVHDKVFPNVPVQKQSDRYIVYTKDFWFRSEAAKRKSGSESAGTGFEIDNTPNYFCDKWALHVDITEDERANADDPLDPDYDAVELLTTQMMIKREKLWIAQYMTASVWQGYYVSGSPADFAPNTNGSGYWDSSSSNPLTDVEKIKSQMKSRTGREPNILVVTDNVYRALKNHPVIMDRIKYTQRGQITKDMLASFFEVDKFLVAGAVFNSAKHGQTASMGYMASNLFLLAYAPPRPGIRVPSAGYTFEWVGRYGAEAMGTRVKKFPMLHLDADRIEMEMAFSFAQVCRDCGALGVSVLQNP